MLSQRYISVKIKFKFEQTRVVIHKQYYLVGVHLYLVWYDTPMGLIYVTGVAGTGKSTILEALKARSLEAYGVEEDEIADWIDTKTALAQQLPPPNTKFDIHQWFIDHDLVINPEKVYKLKQRADESGKDIFLCGVADGEDRVWLMFKKVFVLTLDIETLTSRIKNRKGNDFGKTPQELQKIIDWQASAEEHYRQRSAVIIDATKSPDAVLDKILSSV